MEVRAHGTRHAYINNCKNESYIVKRKHRKYNIQIEINKESMLRVAGKIPKMRE